MRNRMYGGVRGRKTKVGEKLLRFPPTRFLFLPTFWQRISMLIYRGCQKQGVISHTFTRFHTIAQRNYSTFLCYILLKINL